MKIEALQQTATIIRKQILDMVYHAGSGHLGGSFSAVEILTDLYFSQMNIDPQRPDWELRYWPSADTFRKQIWLASGRSIPICRGIPIKSTHRA